MRPPLPPLGPPDDPTSDIEDTGVYSLPGAAAEAEGPLQAALICISGRSIGQMFLLTRGEASVGRAPECDVFLDDEGVSRRHAMVLRRDGVWLLVDVGSTNGTYIGGERTDVHTLEDGDQIHLGSGTIVQFRFQDPREVEFHALMQTFKVQDPLTEALNRRAFLAELDKEVGYARRHREPLSLLMFDVDHFKLVNDTHGHAAGDRVLKSIAERVREVKRKEDVFGRFGGEEFTLLLRGTDAEGAFLLGERVRRAVETLESPVDGVSLSCTISVGVATLGPDADGPKALLELADKRLYGAKRKGRNRTESELFDADP